MKQQNDSLHDLYVMLGPNLDTLSLRRSNEGEAGFETFATRNAQRALEKGFFPDNWLFHYRFTDEQLSRLPLSIERNENYFRSLLPAFNRQHITPTHMLPLERACMLRDRGQPMLVAYEQAQTSKLRDFTTSGSNNAPEMLKARPLFYAYNAVCVDRGVLLFSPATKGLRKLENFLQYIADHYFNSLGVLSSLAMSLHRIPAFDPALKKHVDLWPDDNPRSIDDLTPDQVCELLIGKSVLQSGIECHHFDMRPTLENFKAFITPTKQTGLTISRFNADLCNLLHIEKEGITPELPFPTEVLEYTPIAYMKNMETMMKEKDADGIKRIQYFARERAKDMIEKLFPEYNDTVNVWNMKQQMRIMAEDAQKREEYASNFVAPRAGEMENFKVRF